MDSTLWWKKMNSLSWLRISSVTEEHHMSNFSKINLLSTIIRMQFNSKVKQKPIKTRLILELSKPFWEKIKPKIFKSVKILAHVWVTIFPIPTRDEYQMIYRYRVNTSRIISKTYQKLILNPESALSYTPCTINRPNMTIKPMKSTIKLNAWINSNTTTS